MLSSYSKLSNNINKPIIFVLFLVFFVYRIKENLFYPNLFVEDRYEYFSFLNQFSTIFDANFVTLAKFKIHTHFDYHGYYTVVSIFVAWLFSHLNIWWQPYLYNFFAFSLVVTAIWLFARYSRVTNNLMYLVTILLISSLGVNHIFLMTTMAYSFYTLNLILLLIACFGKFDTNRDLLISAPLASILVWAGPYSVLFIPIAVLRIFFERNKKYFIFSIVVFVNLAIYLHLSMDPIPSDEKLSIFKLEFIRSFIELFTAKVILFGLIQPNLPVALMVNLILLAIIMFFYYQDKSVFRISIIIVLTMIGNLMLFYISGKHLEYSKLKSGHVYLSLFFWSGLIAIWLNYFYTNFSAIHKARWIIFIGLFFLAFSVETSNGGYRYVQPDQRMVPYLAAIKKISSKLPENGKKFVIMRTYGARKSPTVVIGDKRKGSILMRVKDFNLGTDVTAFIYEI